MLRDDTDIPFQRAFIVYPAPYGALTQLYAGTMPEALNYNGEVRRGSCTRYDEELRR